MKMKSAAQIIILSNRESHRNLKICQMNHNLIYLTYFALKGSRRVCSWKQDINKMQQRDDEDYFNRI